MRRPEGITRLYIDFDSFFASVEQQVQPHLRGRPVGVVPLESEHTCCIAASYEAKAYGVKTGTSVLDAKKMCPDIVFTRARHEVYVQMHHAILEEMNRHVPVHAVRSIDEMVCHLMRNEAADALGLAARIKAGLAANVGAYVKASIGFAANELLAKIAAEMHKPNGCTILHTDQLPVALAHLKLTDIPGIAKGVEARLNRCGVYSIPALYALSPKQARAIWGGVGGERFLAKMQGYEVPDIETQKRMFGHSRMLPTVWRSPEKAKGCGRLLTIKAARRLRREPFFASQFTLYLRGAYGMRWEGSARFEPARDDHTMLNALERLYSAFMASGRVERLKQVGIILHGLSPLEGAQLSLFASGEEYALQRKWDTLSDVSDHLSARFGARALMQGHVPPQPPGGYAGAKIAFNRVPALSDFDIPGVSRDPGKAREGFGTIPNPLTTR